VKRLKVGDVFTVPVGDGRAAIGQIVGVYGKRAYYFAIYAAVFPLEESESRVERALQGRLLFMALSMDAKIYVGDWIVLGSAPVDEAIPLPAYKEAVGWPIRYDVVDYSGKRRRKATKAEAASLPNRTVVAPVRLEIALRADLGLEPWVEELDELRADRVITSAAMFR